MMIISSNIQTNISAAQPSVFSKGAELLELLVPICRSCLEHHHSYICKNAVFAVYAVYHEFKNLIPTLADLLSGGVRLQVEHIRVFGTLCDAEGSNGILSVYEQISGLVELLQMSMIEVIRLDCKNDSAHRVSAIQTVNWYCILNPPTRLGISDAFSSF